MAGKKVLKEIKKEHNGPESHKIPFYLADIAKAMNPKKPEGLTTHHTSGKPATLTHAATGRVVDTMQDDEGKYGAIEFYPPLKGIVMDEDDEQYYVND